MKNTMCLAVGAYVAMHIVMTRYTATPESSEAVKLLAASQWFVPTLLLAGLVPRVQKLLAPILKVDYWSIFGLIMVFGCVILQLAGVPGLWWSWSTLGLLIIVVMVVANMNKDQLGQPSALLLGLMVMFLGMASWEALYQTGLLAYHDFFGSRTINYAVVIAEQLAWIIPAVIIMLVLYQRYGHIARISTPALVCLLISVACTTVWFVNDMAIPLMWYQGPEGIVGPFATDASPLMLSVSRGSQSFWLLGVMSLFVEE